MKKILIVAAMLFAVAGFKCNKKINPAGEPTVNVYTDVQERTPGGVLIASQSGVSDALKQTVDETLNVLFADARALNYTNNLNLSDYVIYVLPNCALSPESHSRSFLIRADSYDGTIFDQDPRPGIGKVYAAEMVVPDGHGGLSNGYVICDSAVVDDELRNAIRYGPEHIILKRNDEAEFERTWFHGNGVYHPIIPSAAAAGRKPEKEKTDVVDYAARIKIADK